MVKEFSLKQNGEENLTPNFKVKEFRCKDGTDKILIDTDFVINYLQKVREHFGKPVTINSAYRTLEYNRRIGGAINSNHTKGTAFDISIGGVTPKEIAQYSESIGIKGIIQYANFTHIDSRATKYFATNLNSKVSVKNSFA